MTAPTPAERREWAEGLLEATTPGPWHPHFNNHGDPFVVSVPEAPYFSLLATVSTAADDYGRADAVLLAAAPDLAAAVRDLAEQVEFMQARGDEHLDAFVEAVAERDALREQVERLRDGETWDECDTCGVPIFRHYAWSHPAGTPPQDHDAEPAEGRQP